MKKQLEKLRKELNNKIDSLLREVIKLENSNFRVNSNGWKKIIENKQEVLVNKNGDIWEILGGEFHGEQLFTWNAAMRETKKVGKRMPDDEDFENINIEKIKAPAVGCRTDDGYYYSIDSSFYFWSLTEEGSRAWRLSYDQDIAIREPYSKLYGFSVRCIKKNNY